MYITVGEVASRRSTPRSKASFAGHVLNTPWDPLQLAYFIGYAIWTYLTTSFLMAMPGVEVDEISLWGETQCKYSNSY